VSENEDALRAKVRELLRRGRLPSRRADRMWGGPGADLACAVCQVRIARTELEFELEFAGAPGNGPSVYHVHRDCFAVWRLERHHPSS
jgi:hypothetical protein